MEKPNFRRDGDAYVYTWPDIGVGIGFDMLRDGRGGLQGEISIETTEVMATGTPGHVTWGLFNLAAVETRMKMAERLAELTHVDGRDEWFQRLEYACYTTAMLHRRGSKTVKLWEVAEVRSVEYLFDRFIPVGQTSIIFGRGGGGKGWLVSAMALALASGISLPGIRVARQLPVLYLDYEATGEECRRRIGWLCRGMEIPQIPPQLYYREMSRPLVDEAKGIRTDISRLGIGLVIVDSLVPACADDPTGADPARQVMDAMRSFAPATRLVIAHMTKQGARQESGESSIYGSVFFENLGRSVWELRCTDATQTEMQIAVYHRKVNLGAKLPPVAWRLNWQDQDYSATLRHIGVEGVPELVGHASLSARIRAALRYGAMEAPELAQAVGVPEDVLRATCNRIREVVNLNETSRGRGVHAKWGLVAREESVTESVTEA